MYNKPLLKRTKKATFTMMIMMWRRRQNSRRTDEPVLSTTQMSGPMRAHEKGLFDPSCMIWFWMRPLEYLLEQVNQRGQWEHKVGRWAKWTWDGESTAPQWCKQDKVVVVVGGGVAALTTTDDDDDDEGDQQLQWGPSRTMVSTYRCKWSSSSSSSFPFPLPREKQTLR